MLSLIFSSLVHSRCSVSALTNYMFSLFVLIVSVNRQILSLHFVLSLALFVFFSLHHSTPHSINSNKSLAQRSSLPIEDLT